MVNTYGEDRQMDFWCKCLRCNDQFSIVIWGQKDPTKENEYDGWVEPSSTLVIDDGGAPYHRCGGKIDVFGSPAKINLYKR